MLLQGFLHYLSDSNRELFFVRVSLQPCWNLLVFSSAAHSTGSRKRHIYFLTIKLVFISEEMVPLIYLYIFVVVVVVIAASATLLYLLARCVCMCVCVCERVWYGELFLGIPDKDEEGGWIQAASISGPERHPAVAWRWRRKGGVKRNVCIAAKFMSII